jgi:glycosyltransferase involved in cell wall biosynthesis
VPEMKIAIVGPSHPFRGGIAHHTTLLFRHLRDRHDVRFWAFRRQYPMWLYPAATDRDPSARPLAEPGVELALDSMNPLTWLGVARRVRRFAPDALILPWWIAFWAPQFWTIVRAAKAGTRTQVLFICHNVVEHEPSRLRLALTRAALRSGDRFLVHSDEDRRNLERLVPGARIVRGVLPSFGEVAGAPRSRAEARARLGIERDERILLFFGFVRPYKGLRYLVEAMPGVIERAKARLVVAGEFWKDKQTYLDRIAELGVGDRITLLDRYLPNEEVADVFAAADLVVQPYETATQSAVTQMAFDLGRPVLVTEVGGLPESVRHGVTGYVVPPANPEAIVSAVADFFENGRGPAMEAAVETDRDRFSWNRAVEAVERALVDEESPRIHTQ